MSTSSTKEGPPITINGTEINPDSIPKIAPEIDEFEIVADIETIDSSSPNPNEHKSHTRHRRHNKHHTQTTEDWRGIPYRNYMGHLRPHFDKLEPKKVEILKTEMMARSLAIDNVYPDLIQLVVIQTDPDIMYSVLLEKDNIAKARLGAVYYSKIILGLSGVIETLLVQFGISHVKNFTKAQLETMWMYRTLCLELSTKKGTGGFQGLPTELKIGGLMMFNVALFIGSQYMGSSTSYGGYMGVIKNLYEMFNTGPGTQSSDMSAGTPTQAQGAGPSGGVPLPETINPTSSNTGFDFSKLMQGLFSVGSQFVNPQQTQPSSQRSQQSSPQRTNSSRVDGRPRTRIQPRRQRPPHDS